MYRSALVLFDSERKPLGVVNQHKRQKPLLGLLESAIFQTI